MSLFKQRTYQLGELIGKGTSCDFYRIKGKKKLGVKIFVNRYSNIPKEKIQIETFEREIQISNYLCRNKILTPKYVGIIDILTEKKDLVKGLVIEIIGDEIKFGIGFKKNKTSLNNKYFSINEILITQEKMLIVTEEKDLDFELVLKVKNLYF